MTNGDWIRGLNNKGLAQYLANFNLKDVDGAYAWEQWLDEECEPGMSKEDLHQLLELLAGFDCTYALNDDKAKVIDEAIKIIEGVLEVEK